MAFSFSTALRSITLLGFLTTTMIACRPEEKKEPQPVAPPTQEVTLPNGQKIILGRGGQVEVDVAGSAATGTASTGEQTGSPGANSNRWQDQVRARATSCVESVCKVQDSIVLSIADKYYMLSPAEAALLKNAEATFESKIWPRIDQRISLDHQENITTLKDTKELAKKVPTERSLQVNDSTRRLMMYFQAVQFMSQFDAKTDYDFEQYAKTKKFGLKPEALARLTEDQRLKAEAALKVYQRASANYYSSAAITILEKYGYRAFLLYKYNPSKIDEAKTQFIKEVTARLELLKKDLPLIYSQSSSDFVIEKVRRGESLSEYESIHLKDELSSLEVISDVIRAEWEGLGAFAQDVEALLHPHSVQQSFVKYFEKYSEEKVQSRYKASRENTYKICKAAISAHLATRPEAEQVKAAEDQISRIRAVAKEVARELFVSIDGARLDSVIDQARFDLPTDNSTVQSQMTENLEILHRLKSSAGGLELDKLTPEAEESLIGLFTAITGSVQNKEDNQFERISEFCLSYLPKKLSDFSLTLDNKISVSETTVKAGAGGVGILAHELAHRLHQDVGLSFQASLVSCLKDRHPTPQGEPNIRPDRFLEEDFADHFATLTLRKMSLTQPDYNFGCVMIDRAVIAAGGKTMQFLNLGATEHPLAQGENVRHSTGLFRMIQIAENLGHLTPACQKFAQEEAGQIYRGATERPLVVSKVQSCESGSAVLQK